jgi:hypothetical protein
VFGFTMTRRASMERFSHEHVFLGAHHARNESKT